MGAARRGHGQRRHRARPGRPIPRPCQPRPKRWRRAAEVIGPYGGVYASHIRDEGDYVFAALDGDFRDRPRGAGTVVVSHRSSSARTAHGRSVRKPLAHMREGHGAQPSRARLLSLLRGLHRLRKGHSRGIEPRSSSPSRSRSRVRGHETSAIAQRLGVSMERCRSIWLQPAGAIYFLDGRGRHAARCSPIPQTMIGSRWHAGIGSAITPVDAFPRV